MGSNNKDFVSFGTPLEPLEEDEVPKKRPTPDLTVRDEKGRRRFHGAFTGGFSAGYFNTVGTIEGWAPSSFKSSRKKKADDVQQQNPEDFMDEEDLGVFGIAPRRMQTTKNFRDETSSRKRPFVLFPEGPIPGEAPLNMIIQPVSDSIGTKLLKKMGWKPGQGIGPRVKKNSDSSSQSDVSKVFGCALPPAEKEDNEDIYAKGHTFAPKDVSPLPYVPKDNLFGIGYSGIAHESVGKKAYQSTTMTFIDKGKKLSIRGQAFGVGALEDDDEDIYAKDDMSQYNFALDEPDLDEQDKQKKFAAKVQRVQRELEGFHLAKKPAPSKLHFPPPELPKHFRPVHRPSPGFHVADTQVEEQNRFLDRHSMTVLERGIALEGSYKGSVFDLISEADKKRLTAIKLGQNLTEKTPEKQAAVPKDDCNRTRVINFEKPKSLPAQVVSEKSTKGSGVCAQPTVVQQQNVVNDDSDKADKSEADFISHLSNVSKSFQSTSFKPFIKNEAKQERYEKFLVLAKTGDKEQLENLQPRNMTEWEKQKEMEEFYRAALLYRPLASSLGSRFQSAGHQEKDDEFVEVSVDQEVNQDDQQKAASLKMFGHLTHSAFEWHPDKILCRRFNVPNPYPDSSVVGLRTVKRDKVSIFNFLTTEDELKRSNKLPAAVDHQSIAEKPKVAVTEETMSTEMEASTSNQDQEEVELVEEKANEKNEEEDEPRKPRPPMDLFKAIFQDTDSSDNTSDSEDEQKEEVAKEPSESTKGPERKQNSARGVFANLDLDALCKRPTGIAPLLSNNQKPKPVEKPSTPAVRVQPNPAILYGPALPPTSPSVLPREVNHEKNKPKKHKHKKHKHKSKKSKHKSKHSHKHGTKDRPESDSDSSSSSISSMDIIQKMVEIHRRKQ